jgi:hypothetical protein
MLGIPTKLQRNPTFAIDVNQSSSSFVITYGKPKFTKCVENESRKRREAEEREGKKKAMQGTEDNVKIP